MIIKNLLHFFAGVPPELTIFLLAALPVTELRVAIPVGMLKYHLPAWEVFVWAQLGNVVPAFVIYALCDWWVRLMERRRGWLHRMTDQVLVSTHAKMHGSFSKWGPIAVMLFIALPFPGTGTWTGTLGAYLLGIPFKKALPFIILGNVISGIVVIVAVKSGIVAFNAVF